MKIKNSKKSGFTLVEAIITLAITGVLIGFLVVGVTTVAKQAYLSRANDSAEVIYMALQSAVTDLKTQGRFDEVFSDDYLGLPHHGEAENTNAKFYAVPDAVLDGNEAVSIPGVTNSMGNDKLSLEELQELKDKKSIVYMVLNQNDNGGADHPDSELLEELLSPYISDKSMLNYSVLVEVNRSNRTVRSAFYSEKTPELKYASVNPDETLKKNRADVYYRERVLLDEKNQGYYGTLAVGENDNINKLDNAYVKIYNDDMLTVEWGEFTPANVETWEEKKAVLPGMSYDVYIVNAVDTSKVYYKIEGITPYKDNEYITYVDGQTNNISVGNGEFTGSIQYGTTRMPIYDLFDWDDVSSGIDSDLLVSSFKTFEYEPEVGDSAEVSIEHRLSYLPGTEFGGEGKPGCFRLVLDSVTEAGYDGFSVSNTYPKLKWDENFKVIVEGKYHDEGFTGSMNLSQEVANAYVQEKGLYNNEEVTTTAERGVGAVKEFVNYIKGRLPGGGNTESGWWYEVSYARHLNNIRYIIEDNENSESKKQGKNQNFLVSQDIDWSMQQIGRTENKDENRTVVHRVTVANTTSDDLHDALVANLKVFVPLSTGNVNVGFSGLIQSERYSYADGRVASGILNPGSEDELVIYEPYTVSNLKLAKDAQTSGAYKVEADMTAKNVGLFETISSDGEISHLILSGITGLGNENVGGFAGAFYGKAENLSVTKDETKRWMKLALQDDFSGIWQESNQKEISPWAYPSTSPWVGNHIEGNKRVGGLFGMTGKESTGISGELKNLANGTVYENQHMDNAEKLNGISVNADQAYAGGIVGYVDEKVRIIKVVNTGDISSAEYAGGIAGIVGKGVRLDGTDPEDAEDEYLVKRYFQKGGTYQDYQAEYQNYGKITAKSEDSVLGGNYAGGIVGAANGVKGNSPILSNLRNAGYVVADKSYAGGIVGNSDISVIYNVQNKANVHAVDSYAGGIAGVAAGETRIEGAQNLEPENHRKNSSFANLKGVVIYAAAEDEDIPMGVSAREYAGGVVGHLNGKAQLNALQYNSPDTEHKFIKVNGSSAEPDVDIVLNRSEILDKITLANALGECIPLLNESQITGVGPKPGAGDELGTSAFIGGIAGAVTEEAQLNSYSEAAEKIWLPKVPMRNEGNITAEYGSYAGGIAGVATGKAEIYNAENNQREHTIKNPGVTVQAIGYTGGLFGAVASEKDVKIGISNDKKVLIANNEQLSWKNGSAEGAVVSEEYYTNNARLIVSYNLCAGGIAGFVDTDVSVRNVFNGGRVEADVMEAGGVFGAAAGKTSTQYEYETLSARMLSKEMPYAVNVGAINAGSMAGGIAGAVLSSEVQLWDVFNSGVVTTSAKGTGDYAGGIVGYVMVKNPGVQDQKGVIRHNNDVINGIIMSSDGTSQKPVYTNMGKVFAARSYAGGIVGKGSVSLIDVYNTGEIQALDSYAGGIVGELTYHNKDKDGNSISDVGKPLTLSASSEKNQAAPTVQKMLSYAMAEYSKDYSLYHNRGNVSTVKGANAGGIAGSIEWKFGEAGEKIHVTDVYNAGNVAAGLTTAWSDIEDESIFGETSNSITASNQDNVSAGGIIGYASGITLEYQEESITEVIYDQSGLSAAYKNKLLPNMGNVFARDEAGGLVGSAAGEKDGSEEHVLVKNGVNRGIVRTECESAGGLVGEAFWATVKTEPAVAQIMLNTNVDSDKAIFSNMARVIAGTNNAGGIVGMMENGIITDVFNRGVIYAGNDNAGGVIGYARNSDNELIMEISHSDGIAVSMFGNTAEGEYIFTNTANVTAIRNNAGGIAGKAVGSVGTTGGFFADLDDADKTIGKIVFLDVYSGDPETKEASSEITITAQNNAGGMVGRFVDAIISNEETVSLALADGIYTNNATVKALASNAGGIIGNADKRDEQNNVNDVRGYSTAPKNMKVYTDSNHFQIADVYNIGEVEALSYNAGGIFGVAGAGAYDNTPDLVALAVSQKMLTNTGAITAENNAGGIFGATTAKFDTNELSAAVNDYDKNRENILSEYKTPADILDVFNGGDIKANSDNAGGIAGLAVHLDLRYSKQTLEDTIKANDPQYVDAFLATNTGKIVAGRKTARTGDNAGGIIGYGYQCILQDVFNTGTSASLKNAMETEKDEKITAEGSNSGGIIGQADGLKLFYSNVICENIRRDRNYVYSNVANVKAGRDSAGGIAGKAYNSVQIMDTYNMGAVQAGDDNAGGLVGYFEQQKIENQDGSAAVITSDSSDPLSVISIADNETIIRSSEPSLEVEGKRPYRGEDFIAFDKSVSYITYTTIVTGEDEQYIIEKPDTFGNKIYTNRYTSMAKSAITKDYMDGYHIVAGGNNAGGIVGYSNVKAKTASSGTPIQENVTMEAQEAVLRVENVFNAGNVLDSEVGGVWAKGSNAGGIIGNSRYTHLTYSFDINPGPDNLDVGGTGEENSKGDHSVMTEAFNDPRVMRDPYAIKVKDDYIGLHMVANSAKVRASCFAPNDIHGNIGVSVNISSGEFNNLNSKNAGGAIGSMTGGRAERLYSLKGDVVAPKNLGGIVGHATDYALIKQASRMGVYNKEKYEALSTAGEYNIYSYESETDGLILADLDGVDITAGTQTDDRATTIKVRGSINVGGIVGFADNASEILDTRNLVNVEGRAYVGGIVGQAGKNVNVTLAHNMQHVIGKVNSPEDDAHKDTLITVDQMSKSYLDRSAVDGCYIGGIVGKTYDTNGTGANPTTITMAKNDPLMTQNFEERLAEAVADRMKDVVGGNYVNSIDGRKYVGGITGAHGVVNYAVNTGRLTGVQYIGGISGQGYRITNSFNIADIDAENNYLYTGNDRPIFSQAAFVGGIAGQIGHRNKVKLQIAEPGSYIKNSYNASTRVNGASLVGGIAGYAIAPIDTTYNSATIVTVQNNLGNSGNESAETGNKVGGIVGQVAQDKADAIQIYDSYNSGIVGGTGDTGGILGFVEYYADGEIVNDTELDKRKRIKNSYFIKDSSIRYYNVLSGQVSMEINATLRALNLDAGFPIEEFMYETGASNSLKEEHVVDSEYGARNYSNMISNEYLEYRDLIVQSIGGGSAAGLTGVDDLQKPLNEGKILNWQGEGDRNITQKSNADRTAMGAAKFIFPYDNSGGNSDAGIRIGRDYEFLHLDFSGTDSNNEQGIKGIELDPTWRELENSNQRFASTDNTATSIFYNVWPTSVVNYMKVDVAYNDGGSAEDTVYVNDGTDKIRGTAKNTLASQTNAIGLPLWQVNYNYTGTTGLKKNYVPTSVFTPETLTLTGRFSKQDDKLPRIMKFNIYDGYSRGDYSYDNSDFMVKMVENQIQKTYVMINEEEWDIATASWSNAIPEVSKEIEYRHADGSGSGQKFYFYTESNVSEDNAAGTNAADIMALMEVTLQALPEEPGKEPEIEWKIVLPSIEMDTYLAAKSGFFTAEAVKIYDQSDGIAFDNYTTWERTSRMFNMHFANYYSSKDENRYGSLDYNHNRSIYDQYPDIDLDEFDEGEITKIYEVQDTAALGSIKLVIATPSDATSSEASSEEDEFIEQVTNRLQIANERHLYNLNKNQNQGTAEIDSYLPYVNKDIQLIRDVELSTDDGYNCFIIGLSKGSFNRMTGSLNGMDLDGNIHTIGNLQVDMEKSRYLPTDLEEDSYGMIYDLSGGVVKNLQIGSDSRIRAQRVGALAYQASNGKSGTDVLNNPWYENLEPELRIEEGADAKIYNTRVNADISGREVGGYVYQTVRRFESSKETGSSVKKEPTDTLTITNSQFGGKINTIKGSLSEDRDVEHSLLSAGFLCRMKGKYDDNNLLESTAGGLYPQNTYINGCEVTDDAYIYGKEYASGIVGAVDNASQAQVAVVQKSANNGTVLSTKRASGISQGIMDNAGTSLNKSGVDIWYSYNNGIVQTPDNTGLSSGIGNVVRVAAYSTNNGTVIGRIASGISNYGAKNMEILQCANNGYVRGKQIAGGIVAAPARWNDGEGRALPYRLNGLTLQLDNCYNTGTVVVTTNVDNSQDGGTIDVIYNSYAGGIIGMAVLYDRNVDWYKTNDKYYLSKIEEDDDRKTVIRNCYNAGRVYYEKNNDFSLNHRYVGGIAGGGLHRFVDIQNCYNLSDSEALVGTMSTMYRADVNLSEYTSVTPSAWKQIILPKEPLQDKAYNYNLTAVGDMPYGKNVTSMTFADMLNLENFVGFNEKTEDVEEDDGDDELIWIIDHTTTDVNGYVYPFPQFNMHSTKVGEMYVGDDYQAEEAIPDAIFNVNINKEKFHTNVSETAEAIQIADVTDKTLIPASITYQEVEGTGNLGAFDLVDATASNANPVDVIKESRYTINLDRNSSDYDVYVYDGDADAADYAPALIRRYEVRGNSARSGGKLHDEQSTLIHEMQYFNTAPGGPDYATASGSSLTIGDKEEIGWYMPIHGYYTVVVSERGGSASVAVPQDYNDRILALAKADMTRGGGINANSTASSSPRFQVHFSSNSIENRSGEYVSGSENKPYEVTDQYSVLGMTTSGIAQGATDRRYFQQINDIVITEHAYPMFEFNGVYDGQKPKYKPSDEPTMNGNYTISYQTEKGDFGFMNYLTPTWEALEEEFIPVVSNLNILAEADGEYSNKLGRYFEAANYTTALGIVADYAEYARIENVTTLGNVVYGDTDPVSYREGYNGSTALGGVVGIMKNTEIVGAKNNATLGVRLTPQDSEIDGIEVSWTQHATPSKEVQVAGIAAVALSDGKKTPQAGRLEYVFNNGELRATMNKDAAGIVHTVDTTEVPVRYAANGGWVRAMNGTAAGLVYKTNGVIEDSYNSGLVTAGSVQTVATGNAVGLFWDADSGKIKSIYNAGVVRGTKQGAITQGTKIGGLEGKAYYLKDEDLYWMDTSALPDTMEITDEKQMELYLGFAYVPVELYGFTGDEKVDGIYDTGDPYAISYDDLTDQAYMAGKGFSTSTWKTEEPGTGPEQDGTFIRDYKDDDYPLPQLKKYPHRTRRHLGFPVFLGGAKDVAKVPYEGGTEVVKYVPLDYQAGDRDETFKDTIAVDLNDFSTTARYQVVIYEGDPVMSTDADGKMQYGTEPVLDVTIERRYIDTRDMTFATSVGKSGITPQAVVNPLNKEYGELFSNERGAYFYEVNALDSNGKERPAVFEVKEFLEDNRVELLFNNDILDAFKEPGVNDPDIEDTYYTITIVEAQIPIKEEETDWSNYYSKFSPHFANATAKQSEVWEYGTSEDKPYEIATQRNLFNIGKGTDATAYLGNHYKQTQDIRLSAKKTDAGIANQASGSIGVSQYGTSSANPMVAKATVMNRQSDRPELWTKSIGKVEPGTEQGFRGTYTATKNPSGTPSDPDTITGGYKLVDTRTNIKSSIFGRVNSAATISDVSYELYPIDVSSTSEASKDSVTVAKEVKALLVEENMGTVDNVIFADATDGRTKIIKLEPGAATFALAVGETSQEVPSSGEAPQLPTVSRIAVQDEYQIQPNTTSNTALTMGSIIGQVLGGADLEQLESAATIMSTSTGTSSRVPEDAIGLLIGEITSKETEKQPVTLIQASATGNIDIRVPASNKAIGGLVGNIQDTEVILESVTAGKIDAMGEPLAQISLSTNVKTTANAGSVGGIVGTVQGGDVILRDAKSYYNIITNESNDYIVGGMIGSVEDSTVPASANSKVVIASDSNASVKLEDAGRGNNVLGGVIGQVTGSSRVGLDGVETGDANAREDIYAVKLSAGYSGSSVEGNRIVGGIVGKVEGPDAVVEMTNVTNRLSILADDTKGKKDYYLGGLIGYSNKGILYLHDTDPTEESNIVNQGRISLTNRNESENKIYVAGGIGYMKDSPADIYAVRNTGDVTIATDNLNTDYNNSTVYAAGIVAYAEGELEGIDVDDATETLTVSGSLTVRESLNTGAIQDERNMPDITGGSTAAGIIAMLDGNLTSADTEQPAQIVYNHNVGDVRGMRAAGILTDISENWKDTIVKEETSDIIETPVELKYNINMGSIDAGYEEEEVETELEEENEEELEEEFVKVITGSDITLVYELPLAISIPEEETETGKELDGYDIAECLATPSDAIPGEATPSDATPNIEFYNAALEEMVKAPDYESDLEPPIIPEDRVSGVLLSLGQMQSLILFQEETNWNEETIDDSSEALGLTPPKWIMTEGQGPGITQNQYIPPGGIGRFAQAPGLLQVDTVPMEVTIRTMQLQAVEDRGRLATPSNATPSNAAREEIFELVETLETTVADGLELYWEYSGVIATDDMIATASDATMADDEIEQDEIPEFEFAVVWEVGGKILHITETGILIPDETGVYQFTVTPEMAAEATKHLPNEGELEVEISIAVIIDGKIYRGISEAVTLETVADALPVSTMGYIDSVEWFTDIDLSDCSAAVQQVVNYGLSRRGDPYSQALAGRGNYVDCSYFVMDSYRQLGIELPRTAAEQAKYLERNGLQISEGNLMPGDLIYYSFEKNGRYKNISHVAMYVGDGMVVDASSSRGEVVSRGIYGRDSVVTYVRPIAIQ